MTRRALVMAGGEGRRLRPLTEKLPKPLLHIRGRPILEHILRALRGAGVDHVTISVSYLACMIRDHFGTGEQFGLRISYLHEDKPLGTAGALGLLDEFDRPAFMVNGDILSDIDLLSMLDEHRAWGAGLTVAAKTVHTDLSFGVIELDRDGLVRGYREKPRLSHRLGLGIYVVDPVVKRVLSPGERVDMPDVIARLIDDGVTVAPYDHAGKWLDIGRPEDYARADELWGSVLTAQEGAEAPVWEAAE